MEVKIEGPSQDIGVQVTPKDNGEYRVTYNPTVAGAYKVHITVGGEHIPGSIFNVIRRAFCGFYLTLDSCLFVQFAGFGSGG